MYKENIMKRKNVCVLLALVAAMTASTISASAAGFTDVAAGKYYENPIAWAVEKNVTSGTSATTFSPDKICTRGQIVTLIWNAMGKEEPKSTETNFTDLKADYYKKAVAWAVENGVTKGTSAATFSPDKQCSRAEAVTFLYNAAGKMKVKTKAGFDDVKDTAYYADAVNWAYRKSVTNGVSATKFAPNQKCTRGQIITFIFNAFGDNASHLAHDKYFDSSKLISNWDEITKDWDTVAADYTKVSIEPGADETQLNFAWMTKKDAANKAVVYFGTDKANLTAYEGTVADADKSLTGGEEYVSNKVTVKDIKPNTTYYYQVEKNGVKDEVETYTSKGTDSFKVLLVGDPQVGASKGNTQNGEKLTNQDGAANVAARNDGASWDRTLDTAVAQNKDLSFIISAGDQVNKTGQAKEEEFAAYLNADVLKNIPVATTIGNHDSLTSDYAAHFNTPNATQLGLTKAGGDYYYSYGDALFIVLNTNNYNVAEHKQAIEEAVKSAPDAKWRIVTIHQDIYGSGKSHSETDGMILRTQLTPIFDENDIDVVLQGHDHCYSRSKMLLGDKAEHQGYEFRLNEEKTDYNWNDAYNIKTDEAIPLYPEADDKEGSSALEDFQDDNECYTIESAGTDTVKNPKGILYMTANSATGSKYYELNQHRQNFIQVKNQNWLPSYSVIEITKNKFVIDTYQITNDNKVEKIDKTFTIEKD